MKRFKWLTLLMAFALFAAACGGSDSDTTEAADPAPTEAAEVEEEAMEEEEAEEAPAEEEAMEEEAMEEEEEAPVEEEAMEEEEEAEEVALAQGSGLTFHMITHSDDGPFWSVVKKGAEAAASDVGVELVWMPGNNDPGQMVVDIETAISEGSDGIAASLPSPDQLNWPSAGRSCCRHQRVPRSTQV